MNVNKTNASMNSHMNTSQSKSHDTGLINNFNEIE